jgi:hypothetical protein
MIIITYFSIDLCIWKCVFVCIHIDDDDDDDDNGYDYNILTYSTINI